MHLEFIHMPDRKEPARAGDWRSCKLMISVGAQHVGCYVFEGRPT